jgi:hypothetical protein
LWQWLLLITWIAIGFALLGGRLAGKPPLSELYGVYLGITVALSTWRLSKARRLIMSNLEMFFLLGIGAILWVILSGDALCGTTLACGAVLLWLFGGCGNGGKALEKSELADIQ